MLSVKPLGHLREEWNAEARLLNNREQVVHQARALRGVRFLHGDVVAMPALVHTVIQCRQGAARSCRRTFDNYCCVSEWQLL